MPREFSKLDMAPRKSRLTAKNLAAEVAELRAQLAEAEATVEAIRSGAVDAIIVSGSDGDRVFSLESAETPYRCLVEEINDGALLLRPDGAILYANARFAQMAYTPLEDVIGTPWHRFFPSADHGRLKDLLQAAQLGARREEFSLCEHAGIALPVEVSLSFLKGARAEVYSAIVTDLTERKLAENALRRANESLEARVLQRTADLTLACDSLRRSEERLAWILDTTGVGLWLNDLPLGKLNWDQQTRALFFVTDAEPTIDMFWSRLHPDDREPTRLAVENAIRDHKLYKIEHRAIDPDTGEVRWIRSAGRATYADDGTPVQFDGVNFDITNRKRAEAELRESERRFRAMADGTPLAIWVTDAQGKTRFVNRAYCEFFGVKPDAVENFDWRPLLHPEDVEQYVGAFMGGLRERKVFRAQARVRRQDGAWRWIDSHAEPRFSASGEFLGMAGSSPDITERKQFQMELERLVAERTAKLEELVAEMEHFSYTITHDMRAPLRAMKGFGELISQLCAECPHDERKEFFRKMVVSTDRMDAVIRDALSYSRAARQEMPLGLVNADALLRNMLDSYPEFQRVKAQILIDGDLPRVICNQAGLTQCFSNVLGNAVKFVQPGAMPEIRIWMERLGERARIWIEDKGIGISKENLPGVFDMFSRGQNSYEGTGIGLALVKKVMNRMGGNVGVESELGKGSRFWLELKLARMEQKE